MVECGQSISFVDVPALQSFITIFAARPEGQTKGGKAHLTTVRSIIKSAPDGVLPAFLRYMRWMERAASASAYKQHTWGEPQILCSGPSESQYIKAFEEVLKVHGAKYVE